MAALMVVVYHFLHSYNGEPVPYGYSPSLFPFSLLEEGHTGVALFMTLSGYLFTKLLDGKEIDHGAFLWNRALRLLPLLLIVILANGLITLFKGESLLDLLKIVVTGILLPTLPNGGWSITIEFHYYLIIPLFIFMLRRSSFLLLSIVIAAMAVRTLLFYQNGEVQRLAYWTLIGRIDQFVLGMMSYTFRSFLAHRHVLVITSFTAFMLAFSYFNDLGGFYLFNGFPSQSALWIFLPSIEGLSYAMLVAWYDSSFNHSNSGISKFVGKVGAYSYSIYLLHFFVVFHAGSFVHQRIMDISNFYLACAWGLAFFMLMLVPAALSYHFIELPFFRFRRNYLRSSQALEES